jgi:tRNA U38,U39,U40 pseudouridine synthase TruA
MLVVAVEVEDRQTVLHVEQVVLEEIQVDQVQEMMEHQEQQIVVVAVAVVLLLQQVLVEPVVQV